MCLIQGGSWTGRSSGKQIRGKRHLLLQTRGTTAKAEQVPSLRGAGSLAHGAIVAGVGRRESEGAEQTPWPGTDMVAAGSAKAKPG